MMPAAPLFRRPWTVLLVVLSFLHAAVSLRPVASPRGGLQSASSPTALGGTKTFGSKGKSEVFFCSECGTEHVQWVGRCTSCREWNTVKPFRAARDDSAGLPPLDIRARAAAIKSSSSSSSSSTSASSLGGGIAQAPVGLVGAGFSQRSQRSVLPSSLVSASSLIPMQSVNLDVTRQMFAFYSGEVNRVLGGGLVRGSVILLAGEPGVGKSTLMLQLASSLVRPPAGGEEQKVVVYVSGEENAEQIAARAKRLGLETAHIFLLCEIDADAIIDTVLAMPEPPVMLIVDSIQTMRSGSVSGSMGSVTQTRESAARFVQLAKATGCAVLLSGHVTKTGEVAGPRVLEHMVDTVLYLEGSERAEFRLLRGIKNRFGSTAEVGVLAMKSTGLEDVANPSELFLSDGVLEKGQDGSAVAVIMEGSRPLLAEIQCLVSTQAPQAKFNTKRMSDGFPIQRLLLILAVIEKRLHLPLWSRDVYVNVAGGLRVSEPSCDLAVAITVISSMTGAKVRPGTALIGELGLGGEIRGGRGLEARVTEARKMGFTRVIVPKSARFKESGAASGEAGVVVACATLKESLGHVFEDVAEVERFLRPAGGRRRSQQQVRQQQMQQEEEEGGGGEEEEQMQQEGNLDDVEGGQNDIGYPY